MDEHCNDDEILAGLAKEPSHPNFEHAISCLYEKCYPPIQRHVLENSGSVQDAEDLFQDVIAIILKKINDGILNLQVKFCTFLLAVARNVWLNRLREQKGKDKALGELKATNAEAEYELEEPELLEARKVWLHQCLKKLGSRCQDILHDYYFDKMSMPEIAMKYGFTDAHHARQEKLRCMNRLRNML